MKRMIGIAVVLGAAAVLAVMASGSGFREGPHLLGRARQRLRLDQRRGRQGRRRQARARSAPSSSTADNYHARVEVKLDQQGFDKFRTDAFCESRPQSLIGEYFIDCQPGANGKPLKTGATIPVTHTATTIAARPRSRTSCACPSASGCASSSTSWAPASPATGRPQRGGPPRGAGAARDRPACSPSSPSRTRPSANLPTTATRSINGSGQQPHNVGRWVVEARDTAQASATRRADLAATFQKLPAFLAELRPRWPRSGQTADQQTPGLRNLDAASGQLTRFFKLLGPFADASRPAFSSLGQASQIGRGPYPPQDRPSTSSTRARPRTRRALQEPRRSSSSTSTTRRTRSRPTSARARSTPTAARTTPASRRCSSTSSTRPRPINVYDPNEYILKVAAFADPDCSPYADAEKLRGTSAADLALYKKCSGNKVGPNGPGLLGEPNVSDTGEYPPEVKGPSVEQLGQRQPRPCRDTVAQRRGQERHEPEQSGGGSQGGAPPPPNAVEPVTTIVQQVVNGQLPNIPGVPSCRRSRTCPTCPRASIRRTSCPRTCRTRCRAASRADARAEPRTARSSTTSSAP